MTTLITELVTDAVLTSVAILVAAGIIYLLGKLFDMFAEGF